jgi:primosomal protein N' (replication factor Y)
VLSYSVKQDYEAFYKSEINLRRALVFPPFCNICVFNFACEKEDLLNKVIKEFSNELETRTSQREELKLIVYGPFDAPIYKLNNVYRKRFLIKYKPSNQTSLCFEGLLNDFLKKYQNKISINIDINPSLV